MDDYTHEVAGVDLPLDEALFLLRRLCTPELGVMLALGTRGGQLKTLPPGGKA